MLAEGEEQQADGPDVTNKMKYQKVTRAMDKIKQSKGDEILWENHQITKNYVCI